MGSAPTLAIVALFALASASDTAEHQVDIPGKLFEPERVELLVGETITWRNDDAVTHTVTADDGAFDSRDLPPGESFSFTFDRPGTTRYRCAIHRFMTGEVDVFALALSGPAGPVAVGASFTLRGRTAPGTAPLVIERRAPDGTFVEETRATAGLDGRFRISLQAAILGDYRARAGTLMSPVVRVEVHPTVTLRARAVGSSARLDVSTTPPQPEMPVELQAYSLERFDWYPLARANLGRRSRVRFVVPRRRRLYLRVALLRASTGLVGGTSNVVRVAGTAVNELPRE